MFAHLNPQIIFKVINLLLMEKSIIIHGKHAGIVTSITLAVVNLILPFIWEGIFVPLVPDNARELFGAPVPLIVGTTSAPRVQDVAPTTAILFLNDDCVNETATRSKHSEDGTAIEFSAWFVRLPEVSADLPVDEELCKRMEHVRTLLCRHCRPRLEYCEETTEQLMKQFGAINSGTIPSKEPQMRREPPQESIAGRGE
jgi:DENN (AEX-3) domain.